jgi:hypothetical protein
VTEAQQARYVTQAIALAKKDKRIPMFVWFVFRDSSSSPWQSGVYRTNGAAKPAASKWTTAARTVDRINGKVSVKGNTVNPPVVVYLREFCANNPVGATVGATSQTFRGTARVQSFLGSYPLGVDCSITVRLVGLTVRKGQTYRVTIDANTVSTAALRRTITIVGT